MGGNGSSTEVSRSPIRVTGVWARGFTLEPSWREAATVLPAHRGLAGGLTLNLPRPAVNLDLGWQHSVFLRDDSRPVYQTGPMVGTTQTSPGALRQATAVVPHLVIDGQEVRGGLGVSLYDGFELRLSSWLGIGFGVAQFHPLLGDDPSQISLSAQVSVGETPPSQESFLSDMTSAAGHMVAAARFAELQQAIARVPGLRGNGLDIGLGLVSDLNGAMAVRNLVRGAYLMSPGGANLLGAALTLAGGTALAGGASSDDLPLFTTGVIAAGSGLQILCRLFSDGGRNADEQLVCRSIVVGVFAAVSGVVIGTNSNQARRAFGLNLAIPALGFGLSF